MKGFKEFNENQQTPLSAFEKVKPTKVRIELLRKIEDAGIKDFIAKVDAATTKKEAERIDYDLYNIAPNIRDWGTIGGLDAFWTAHDLVQQKIRELNKAAKAIADAAKVEKVKKETEVKQAKQAKITRHLNLPELKNVLEELGCDFEKEIFASMMNSTERQIKRLFTDSKFNLVNPGTKVSRQVYMSYQNAKQDMSPFMTKEHLNADWKKTAEKMATEQSKFMVEVFKIKMATKLGEVIDRKGGGQVSRIGSLSNHSLYMSFPDGSSFNTRTQQVISRSPLGKIFARYPTTFHDVTFADKTKMKTPSAAKMQEEFGVSDIE